MTSPGIWSFLAIFIFIFSPPPVDALGSASTLAIISSTTGTVCGIVAGKFPQSVQCTAATGGVSSPILAPSNISFDAVSGGKNFFCGLRSGGISLFCWDAVDFKLSNATFIRKRIKDSSLDPLRDLAVGDDHVCAVENRTGLARCWRASRFPDPPSLQFQSITAGRGFTCGISTNDSRVSCWGSRATVAEQIQRRYGNESMRSLVAGESHACGVSISGFVLCSGRNESGQLIAQAAADPFEFSSFALEANRSCAIRGSNGTLVCWGGGSSGSLNYPRNESFVSIVSGTNFTCGLVTVNLSIICWGLDPLNAGTALTLPPVVPGVCTDAPCSCGVYLNSLSFCSASRRICSQCMNEPPLPPPPPSPPLLPSPPLPEGKERMNKGLLAFAIVGSVGAVSGICSVIYLIWTGICCCRQKKIHNSVQPTMGAAVTTNAVAVPVTPFSPMRRSSTIRRQSSRLIRRQRSGTSSKHADRAEEFTLLELAAATDNFSWENKIGAGSFGTVYKGKLMDGREVAIKRGETVLMAKKFQEKESAFQSELAFLSRLHHKHLVGLVGSCEEKEERLLVYEYMKNGALYDHLHTTKKSSGSGGGCVLNSWKMRIKISLDAARGIEYLHSYAVPPIIHRDIKSSNILLDANWTARVSDFGLSLDGPETEEGFLSIKAAGTVGYMDPEYYGLHHLTAKSDVYGLGVVLLELLTGKRAIFKDEDSEGGHMSVVDYAVPRILAGELELILDTRAGMPQMNEAEAVELVAYTAVHCVNLEGRERPTMTDIVANLERALALCEDSHCSISSVGISLSAD